mmetsp:Transcript_56460/g.100539  ORF Transcript_56460/g.100539 Transcript_56460/m.100539 type:complete len:242 (-) Transcript_56460:971-1696(-)
MRGGGRVADGRVQGRKGHGGGPPEGRVRVRRVQLPLDVWDWCGPGFWGPGSRLRCHVNCHPDHEAEHLGGQLRRAAAEVAHIGLQGGCTGLAQGRVHQSEGVLHCGLAVRQYLREPLQWGGQVAGELLELSRQKPGHLGLLEGWGLLQSGICRACLLNEGARRGSDLRGELLKAPACLLMGGDAALDPGGLDAGGPTHHWAFLHNVRLPCKGDAEGLEAALHGGPVAPQGQLTLLYLPLQQ